MSDKPSDNESDEPVNSVELDDWVVEFINLPPQEQVDFLYRFSLEQELREKVERKVFGPNKRNDNL